MRTILLVSLAGLLLGTIREQAIAQTPPGVPAQKVGWKKTVVDAKFRSEGAAVADFNKDGKLDIAVGDFWYEAPEWKMKPIRKSEMPSGFDPAKYSKCMICFVDDFNKDSWPDVAVIGFPGAPCHWYENPQNKEGEWKEHQIWRSACNETPLYLDLFKDGQKRLVMAIQPEGQMCWLEPDKDLSKPWVVHPISVKKAPCTEVFTHGLGLGDLNGDGRLDIIVHKGWWEQPADAKTTDKPWTFHAANLGDACADMYVCDVDGDGRMDVVSSSAHLRGIWWHQNTAGATGVEFRTRPILNDFTQTHAMHYVDINGDGQNDFVTGKRWWAHGAKGDVDPTYPSVIYWIETVRGPSGQPPFFRSHLIDADSGIGTQFTVTDFNGDGLLDVISSNKKGVFILLQTRS
jgi:hypothetical protein